MKIEHLKTFLEIAGTGNFIRAAERLNVTQSTVSARIKSLEEQLGQSLFQRSHTGAELTAAGRQLQRYAMTMVRAWEQARQEIALPEGFRQVFGIGAQVSLWERLILKWIPWMRARQPDVALRAEADYSASILRQLADGLLDIGVMYHPRTRPGLVIEPLLEEHLVLVATEPRTMRPGWVADYVYVDWGDNFRVNHHQAFPEMETPSVSVGLGALGLQYILQCGGSGYFPMRVVRPLLAEGRLHRVAEAPVFRRPAFVVYPASPVDQTLLEVALDGLRETALSEEEA